MVVIFLIYYQYPFLYNPLIKVYSLYNIPYIYPITFVYIQLYSLYIPIIYPVLFPIYPNQPGSTPARGHLSAGGELPAAPTQPGFERKKKNERRLARRGTLCLDGRFFVLRLPKREKKTCFFFLKVIFKVWMFFC